VQQVVGCLLAVVEALERKAVKSLLQQVLHEHHGGVSKLDACC
jgi:hypothetical protein